VDADQVGKLLGLMALADNRKPPEDDEGRRAMIAFWLGQVGDLAYADAAEAVQAHYRDSREWIMPADIRRRVKAMRADRLARKPLPAPPAEVADQRGRYQQIVAANVKRIADGFAPPPAIEGAPLPGDPPVEWQAARESLKPPDPVKPDPREVALEQVKEARAKREGQESGEPAA
jgi:hypothetical protein